VRQVSPRRSPRIAAPQILAQRRASNVRRSLHDDKAASGALFAGQATTQTTKRAHGYTHFRLENAQMSQGSQLAAVYSTEGGNTLASGYGGAAFATSYSSGLSTPIYKRTADVAVTVVMFHADEP
jgi:hypothetical protein